jgi:ubiquitin-activating enzyme E1
MINTLQKCVDLIHLNKTQSFEACIALAVTQFNDMFDYSIRDLLFTFPLDAKDKEGNPFWSGPKRAPNAVAFDPQNPLHINYVLPFANLIAVACCIPENRNATQVTEMAASATVPAYIAKKAIVKLPEEEKE